MESNQINHISINDLFWFNIKGHLINFGYNGLPEDIHLTVVFDEKNPDLNLHVTKNTTDLKDKPHIKIAVISWLTLEEILPDLFVSILNNIFQKIDIPALKKQHTDLMFISYADFENSNALSLIEKALKESFKDITSIKRKTRLKIKGDYTNSILSYIQSEELKNVVVNSLTDFDETTERSTNGGIIIADGAVLNVIRVYENWYTFRMDLKKDDILVAFMDFGLAKELSWKLKRAIIHVKGAKTYADTKDLNNPIRLEISE